MAFDTPTPTQDTAAPQPTPAPAQTAAPTQATPAPTDASQQDTAAPEPGGAVAPASTLPPSTSSGVHGVLAHVALGALAGAVAGIKKVGSGIQKAAPYIPVVAAAQRKAVENSDIHQMRQQEMEQSKVAASDEHQTKQLALQTITMDNLHKVAENAHLEKMYPGLEEAQRMELMKTHAVQDAADRDLLSEFERMGLHVTYKQFKNLTSSDAQKVGPGGDSVLISNGKTGDEAGGGFINNKDMESFILPEDIKVIASYEPDKDGIPQPVYKTLHGGENTALDMLVAHQAGMKQLNDLQAKHVADLTAKKDQATITQDLATAEKEKAEAVAQRTSAALNEAYIKQLGGGGAGGTPTTEVAQAISTLPPNVQKDLQQFEPGIQGLLIRGAGGWIDPNTFPQRLTKGGIGITRSTASAMMTEINPNWTDALYNNIKKAQADFIGGKEGQSVRSFNQFLVHGATLKGISDDFQRTNSPLLNTPLNVVSSKYMGSPEVPELMTAVEAARQEWQSFIDSGYKPDSDQSQRAAVLMSDASSVGQIAGVLGVMGDQAVGRLDQLNESYRTATGTDYPNLVTPSGLEAAGKLGLGSAVSKYRSGGSYNQGRNAPATPQIPAGKVAAYSKSTGKMIGYADDANGTNFVKF